MNLPVSNRTKQHRRPSKSQQKTRRINNRHYQVVVLLQKLRFLKAIKCFSQMTTTNNKQQITENDGSKRRKKIETENNYAFAVLQLRKCYTQLNYIVVLYTCSPKQIFLQTPFFAKETNRTEQKMAYYCHHHVY